MSDLISYDAFGDTGALHAIFQPTTVAILGATGPNTLGEKALAGLTAGDFERLLVAVDPGERPNAFGISVCSALDDVPAPVDLAVVATLREETLEAIEMCVAAGVRGIVVLTGVAGSAERRLEFDRQICDRLRGTSSHRSTRRSRAECWSEVRSSMVFIASPSATRSTSPRSTPLSFA